MFLKVGALLLAVFLAVASTAFIGDPQATKQQKIDEVLDFAVHQCNAQSDSKYNSHVVKVTKVDVQVFPYLKYVFQVIMTKTSYKDEKTANQCPAIVDQTTVQHFQHHACKLVVQKLPGHDKMKLVENTC